MCAHAGVMCSVYDVRACICNTQNHFQLRYFNFCIKETHETFSFKYRFSVVIWDDLHIWMDDKHLILNLPTSLKFAHGLHLCGGVCCSVWLILVCNSQHCKAIFGIKNRCGMGTSVMLEKRFPDRSALDQLVECKVFTSPLLSF